MTTAVILSIAALGAGADIEVPFRIGENAIIVDAQVNGKTVSCLFDTGFSGSFVIGQDVNVGPATGEANIQDFVGVSKMKTVDVKSISLAGHPVPVSEQTIIQDQGGSDYSFSYGTHVDGIMGLSVVASYVVEINFEQSKMILHPKTYDITQRQPDNKKTFAAKMLPLGRRSVELTVKTPEGKNMHLALDTGNGYFATTHKDVLERVGIWKEGRDAKFMKKSLVASGPVNSWYCRMKGLTIFGVPVPDSVWSIIDLPSGSATGDGTVGFGFLKNFNITFDLDRRRVWLDNFTGKVDEAHPGGVGVAALYDARTKRVRVAYVTPDSPADKAGIKGGDNLLAIGDVTMTSQSFRTIEAMLEGAPGSTIRIQTSRNGTLLTSNLTRVEMVNDP